MRRISRDPERLRAKPRTRQCVGDQRTSGAASHAMLPRWHFMDTGEESGPSLHAVPCNIDEPLQLARPNRVNCGHRGRGGDLCGTVVSGASAGIAGSAHPTTIVPNPSVPSGARRAPGRAPRTARHGRIWNDRRRMRGTSNTSARPRDNGSAQVTTPAAMTAVHAIGPGQLQWFVDVAGNRVK